MSVAMIDDQMTLARHPTYQIWHNADRFTADTEGRTDILFLQDIQQPRRDIWLRTIIETKQNLAPANSDVLDPLPNRPLCAQPPRKFRGCAKPTAVMGSDVVSTTRERHHLHLIP